MGHKGRMDYLNLLIENEDSESDSDSDSDSEYVQWENDDYEEVPASMDGHDSGYERAIPPQFEEERDDRLMHSMIKNYAREVKHKGDLTGHLFLNKADAKAASQEVVSNHVREDRLAEHDMGNDGGEGDDEEGDRFEETWNHFDINHDGLVEVERMPQFFRMLLGNALAIDL